MTLLIGQRQKTGEQRKGICAEDTTTEDTASFTEAVSSVVTVVSPSTCLPSPLVIISLHVVVSLYSNRPRPVGGNSTILTCVLTDKSGETCKINHT